jgi:hypothetical protein
MAKGFRLRSALAGGQHDDVLVQGVVFEQVRWIASRQAAVASGLLF